MHGFVVEEKVTLSTSKFVRTYKEGKFGSEVSVETITIDTSGEIQLVSQYFNKKNHNEVVEDNKIPEGVKVIQEDMLLKWEHCPPRLGRVTAKIIRDQLMYCPEEAAPLLDQLGILAQKVEKKAVTRIAIINGFGSNLGDMTIGMTALRIVARTIKEKISSEVSIDFLLGPNANAVSQDIIGYDDFIGQVYYDSPTLIEFSKYDAYFDFSNLLNLPKFTEMPTVDWYLWWMGLNHEDYESSEKRNVMTTRWEAWEDVNKLLKDRDAKYILFNPKASVDLRSIPDSVAAKLLKKLLHSNKKAIFVVDRKISVTHKRILDLSDKIDNASKFKALVGQMSGIITVDSFAPQLSDACSIPTIHLCSTIPASYYPYYTYSKVIEIPKIESLPLYKKFKAVDPKVWEDCKSEYAECWSNLDAASINSELESLIELRLKNKTELRHLVVTSSPPGKSSVIIKKNKRIFKYERTDDTWVWCVDRLCTYANNALKTGMEVIVCCPGRIDIVDAVAGKLLNSGLLHIFEPRNERMALISGDLLGRQYIPAITWHSELPVCSEEAITMPCFDSFSSSSASNWGNLIQKKNVATKPIDSFLFERPQALFLIKPCPVLLVLKGAIKTILAHKPAIYIGNIKEHEVRELLTELGEIKYQFWADTRRDGDIQEMNIVGFDENQDVNLIGFKRIKL